MPSNAVVPSTAQPADVTISSDQGDVLNNSCDIIAILSEFQRRLQNYPHDVFPALHSTLAAAQFQYNTTKKLQEATIEATSKPAAPEQDPADIIPRFVVAHLREMRKLDTTNWASWSADLEANLRCVPVVHSMLFDAEPLEVEAIADARVVAAIRSICRREGPRNVRFLLDFQRHLPARQLYDYLKDYFAVRWPQGFAVLSRRLEEVVLRNDNIERAIQEFQTLAAQHFSEIGKSVELCLIDRLRALSKDNEAYASTWRWLELSDLQDDYSQVCRALRKQWTLLESKAGQKSSYEGNATREASDDYYVYN